MTTEIKSPLGLDMLRAADERDKSSKQRCPALRVFDMLKSHASLCPPEEYFAYTSAAVAYC